MGIQPWVLRDVPCDVPGQAGEDTAITPTVPNAKSLPVVSPPAVGETSEGAVSAHAKPVNTTSVSKSPVSAPVFSAPPAVDEEPPLPTDDNMPELDLSEVDLPDVEMPSLPVIDVRTLDWPELQTLISACTACELHKNRTQTVFGVGNQNAEWMIVGEAPGADEDQQGEPFVGASGQLLNNMLKALGLQREQVFITNIIKCHPPENRNPHVDELAQCEAFLQRQVALVKPKLILAVGGVAAHNLLKLDTPVSKLRGQVHHYGNVPLVVTYHPAYLLRKPSEKAKSWADLKFAASIVKGEQP